MPIFIYGGGGVDTSIVTATPGDVWLDKVFVDSNGDTSVGTLNISAGDIRNGAVFHGIVGTFSNTTNGATAAQVLSGKTVFVNGESITGTMVNWAGTPQAIDAVRLQNGRFEVAVARGFHDYNWAGNSYEYLTYTQVANTIGLTAAKLATGQSVLGLTGTYTGLGNATAAQVLTGRTFSTASLSNATGTMANLTSPVYQYAANTQLESNHNFGLFIPKTGYYSTSNFLYRPITDVFNRIGTNTTLQNVTSNANMRRYSAIATVAGSINLGTPIFRTNTTTSYSGSTFYRCMVPVWIASQFL